MIGRQIVAARRNKRLTQEQFAEEIDRSVSFTGHIERGTRKMSLETFAAICKALDLSADSILNLNTSAVSKSILAKQLLDMALFMAESLQ